MNIGCSTAFCKDSLEEACARIAAMGFEWIDLICIPGWNHVLPERLVEQFDQEAGRVERLLERYRLRAHAFNMAVPHPHQRFDHEVNRARREQTRALVRLMKRLGVARSGFYPGYYAEGRSRAEVVEDTAASIREMVEIAGEAGVEIGPEIHRFTPFETPAQARELLEAVPGLRVVYDASHFIMQGIPLEQTEFLAGRALHAHFRGSRKEVMQCHPAEGTADFLQIVRMLRRQGYTGNATVEYIPGFEGDVEAAIRECRHWLDEVVAG